MREQNTICLCGTARVKQFSDHYERYPKLKWCFQFVVSDLTDPIQQLKLGCLLLQCAVGQLQYSRKYDDGCSDAKVVFFSVATGIKSDMVNMLMCALVRLYLYCRVEGVR